MKKQRIPLLIYTHPSTQSTSQRVLSSFFVCTHTHTCLHGQERRKEKRDVPGYFSFENELIAPKLLEDLPLRTHTWHASRSAVIDYIVKTSRESTPSWKIHSPWKFHPNDPISIVYHLCTHSLYSLNLDDSQPNGFTIINQVLGYNIIIHLWCARCVSRAAAVTLYVNSFVSQQIVRTPRISGRCEWES